MNLDQAFQQLEIVLTQMSQSPCPVTRSIAAEILHKCNPKLFAKRLLDKLCLDSNPTVASIAKEDIDAWNWEPEPEEAK